MNKHSCIIKLADDVKLLREGVAGFHPLQSNVSFLVKCCEINDLPLKVRKWKAMFFSRTLLIYIDFYVSGLILQFVTSFFYLSRWLIKLGQLLAS